MPALAYSVSLKSIEAIFGARGFTPSALFSSGEQGAWYDPSDLSTMFQDAAGTTPVTAVEQPVELLLDKSKGLALGSELLTNGDFSSGTGWTVGSGWAISGGTLNYSGGYNASYFTAASNAFVLGRYYKVTLTVSGNTSGNVNAFLNVPNNGALNPVNISGDGEKNFLLLAGVTCNGFHLVGNSATGAMSIDNISVRELSGNHASQSTSASRPVLSAMVNLLTYSEQFDNAVWNKVGLKAFGSGSVVNAAVAPDNTTTADLITEDTANSVHRVQQSVSVSSGASVTAVVFLKKPSTNARTFVSVFISDLVAKNYAILVNLNDGSFVNYTGMTAYTAPTSASVTPVGDDWYRCSVTVTLDAGRTSCTLEALLRNNGTVSDPPTYTGDGSSGIYIWGADLRVSNQSTLPAYQRVAAATDYDTSGFPLYLKFDGTDDSLATGTIDFTATDKMSVFAGVRELPPGAGVLAELSASINANTSAFLLLFQDGSTSIDSFYSRGSGSLVGARWTSAPTTPTTQIYTGLSDIAAPSVVLRENGTQVASSTSSQGTGNYGNYPLYIGRRGGSTLPYNGNLYSLIVRGAQSTAAQIASTETWVNGKTMAY